MYMSANFQVISDPVVFQNAQVTIYRAQKVVTVSYTHLTYYPDAGMIDNDYWLIPYENSMSKTRVDYATQKPEALLEKIIPLN